MMLALLFSFSLSRIRLRYVLTVFGLTPSSAAICLNATPEPNMHSTWYSRWESASCPGLVLPPPRPVMSMLASDGRSEEHTSELQSQSNLVCRLLLEKKKILCRLLLEKKHATSLINLLATDGTGS